MKKPYLLLALILVVLVGALAIVRGVPASGSRMTEARQGTGSLKVARGAFVKTLRMTGLVESIHFHNVAAPRLVGVTGPGSNTLIITKLMPSGSQVVAGQLLVEFDRQNQLKAAIDKRSEHRDLEEQIRKKRAEQEQAARERRDGACGRGECRRKRPPRDEEECLSGPHRSGKERAAAWKRRRRSRNSSRRRSI